MQLGHAAAALMPARDVIKEKATDRRERKKPERKREKFSSQSSNSRKFLDTAANLQNGERALKIISSTPKSVPK
jgi:hypothetical protein